jgi:hypothetical protein
MNLLEQSLWWVIPFVLLMLLMLHAMMEFTVSLLVQRPPADRTPILANELRRRLLAENEVVQPYRLVEGKDCDLEIIWELGDSPHSGRWAISKGSSHNHIRLLLDEHRNELRMNQVSRSFYFFFGLVSWLPRIEGYAAAQAGPPGVDSTKEISRIANRYGWTVRPVLWWFQATHRGYHFLETLTPTPLRQLPARRFWGILYPLSYILGIAYLIMIIGALDWDNFLIVVGVSAAWWGTWGFLVWAIRGFPAFWHGRHR